MERQLDVILEEHEGTLELSSMSKDSYGEEMLTETYDTTKTDGTAKTDGRGKTNDTTETFTDGMGKIDHMTETDNTTETVNTTETDDRGEKTDDRNVPRGYLNGPRVVQHA